MYSEMLMYLDGCDSLSRPLSQESDVPAWWHFPFKW